MSESKLTIQQVSNVIKAYEDLRMGGEPEHMVALYHKQSEVQDIDPLHHPYLVEKHAKHVRFNPFNSFLDSRHQLRYAELVLARLEKYFQ
tara:strand:+ start:124 stop:393 length:270 start_codon:yes stop_codon:yes gene_type:complete